MSIEGPEARILAEQLHKELHGHRIVACDIDDVAGLQPTGFVNEDLADFDRLLGGTINEIRARGNAIKVSIDNGTNLVIGPEYGGRVLLHSDRGDLPAETHLVLSADDGRRVSVRLTGMGSLRCDTDDELAGNYVVELGPESSAVPGSEDGLPALEASVGAFTRLWLGVRPATGLAATDRLTGPRALLDDLDRILRLPVPKADWDF